MKLKRWDELKREAVTRSNHIERVTSLSESELKRAVGGVEVACADHAHYHYNSTGCTAAL